ncbi:extracellular solute-binding protein [Paenibacillus sp. GYB003]
MPYSLNFAGWYYNKSIFDKFGVKYPKDLMTWDETFELARKLTRTDGGEAYIGMELDAPDRIGGQMSLPLIDLKTNKALIDTEGWKKVLTFMKQNYELPGYKFDSRWDYPYIGFLQKKNVAMMTSWADQMLGPLEDMHKKGDSINWDWVALPNFKEYLGTGREVDVHMMIHSSLGKKKEIAWKVMSHILSDEVQTIVSKSGRLPTIANPDIEKLFGSDLEHRFIPIIRTI